MSSSVPRLKRRQDFLRVAAGRRRWVAAGCIVEARRRPADESAGPTRVGFTVSRKVGSAVIRNRVRRRLRAAVETVVPAHAEEGYDLVVIGRAGSRDRPFALLLDDLETALKRLGAYRDDTGKAPEASRGLVS